MRVAGSSIRRVGSAHERPALAAVLVLLLLFPACASTPKPQPAPSHAATRDVIVLLSDHQGKTGAIIVSGASGERLLSEPGQAVSISAGASPGAPFLMTREDLQSRVGPALSALPPPPLQFTLYFENDTADLTAESWEKVRRLVRTIRERAPVDISVVGHTDTVASRGHNYRLSLRRARAVAVLLAKDGIDPSILEITSHGEDNPLVPTGDQVPEPRNRRVEVTVR